MHLMCNVDASGKRAYTLKKVLEGKVTKSAHPARFSPDDKWSRHRITLKKRFGLLQTEKSELLSFAVPDQFIYELLVKIRMLTRDVCVFCCRGPQGAPVIMSCFLYSSYLF